MSGTKLDLTGKRFERLCVDSFAESRNGARYWNCKCECGGRKTVSTEHLRSGQVRSCGCLRVDAIEKSNVRHGMARQSGRRSEHWIWANMIGRCSDKNSPRYGGRGIKVCDEWLGPEGFVRFLDHVGPRPSVAHTIDRFPDTDGNYEPGNVRWATRAEQNRNYSRNIFTTVDGERLCLKDAALRRGLKPWAVWQRVKRGWSIEKAFNTPLGPPGSKYKPQ